MERLSKITNHLAPSYGTKMIYNNDVKGTSDNAMTVLVTGGAGNIAYTAIFLIAKGNMLGNIPIHLRLLDIPPMAAKQEGVAMEVRDGAFPLVKSLMVTTDAKKAFENVDIALLIGARPRGKGMVRADLLKANAKIFEAQGKALNNYASRNVKVLVVGNPANTNALIASHFAPNIPKENFGAMTRLDQNRSLSLLSSRTGVAVSQIKNVTIWGNHSKTQYPDVNNAIVTDFPVPGINTPVRSVVNDDKWLASEFIRKIQYRGKEVIDARGASSAASAANAAVDCMRSWILGTEPGEWVNMGIYSDGSYGIPKGIMYSMPLTFKNGNYTVVSGLKLDEFSKDLMRKTAEELLSEKESAFTVVS